jgi:ribose 5-phosphate isomerase B
MKISVGADHRGFIYKERIKELLSKQGYEVADFGTDSVESVDYPDFSVKVGNSVASGETDFGVLVCGSGIGVCITANKVKGIRSVNVCNEKMAEMGRRHNNANVICFGQDCLSFDIVERALNTFLTTQFEGGRHERRVEKISSLTGK